MAKHKSQRALFELLAEQRRIGKGRPEGIGGPFAAPKPPETAAPGAAAQPGDAAAPPASAGPQPGSAGPQPEARQPEQPRPEGPRPELPRAAPSPIARRAGVGAAKVVLVIGGLRLTSYHLAIVLVAAACLCVLFYFLGARLNTGDGLPDVPAKPTVESLRNGPVQPGLVAPGPVRPVPPTGTAVRPGPTPPKSGGTPAEAGRDPRLTSRARTPGDVGPTPPKGGAVGPTPPTGSAVRPTPPPPAAAGPRYRVRIQRLDVSHGADNEQLRKFFADNGVATDSVTAGGYQVLYSRDSFADKKESDVLAQKVNALLGKYEEQTRQRMSKDAYTVLKKE
jgi:hypothetical protein